MSTQVGTTAPASNTSTPGSSTTSNTSVVSDAARDATGKFVGKTGENPGNSGNNGGKTGENPGNPISDAAKEAARKLKVKYDDGKEEEIDENEVLSVYKQRKGHQSAANKILQEGKAARKQAEEFISMMRDPDKFYETAKKLGHDPRVLAEKYLAAQIEEEMLDPREKELRATKRELDQMKELDRQQKEAVKAQRDAILKQKYSEDYNNQFIAALKETGLPANKEMVADMAKYVARAAKIGFKMTALEAARMVDEDLTRAIQYKTRGSDAEVLLRLLGEETANKIRTHDIAKIKNPEAALQVTEPQTLRDRPRQKERTRMTHAEWREFNRK